MFSFNGKVALVTGGARSIGLAMVKKLLENGLKGVAIVDICEEAGQKAVTELTDIFGSGKTMFIKADVSIKSELEGAFELTVKIYSQLDIVINNAGIVNEIEWKKTVAINLVAVIEGTYLALQKYLPKHISGEEGVIVNTASVSGFYTATQSIPVYCAAKHGLIGFGRVLGGDEYYKKYKVRILTICPGLVETPIANFNENLKVLFPHKMEEEFMALNSLAQSPERVGEALIEAIKNGKSGSLWVIENGEPVYEIEVPHYRTMKI